MVQVDIVIQRSEADPSATFKRWNYRNIDLPHTTRTSFGRVTSVNDRPPRYEYLSHSKSSSSNGTSQPREKRKTNGKENHAPKIKKPKVEPEPELNQPVNGLPTHDTVKIEQTIKIEGQVPNPGTSLDLLTNIKTEYRSLQKCVVPSIQITIETIKKSKHPNDIVSWMQKLNKFIVNNKALLKQGSVSNIKYPKILRLIRQLFNKLQKIGNGLSYYSISSLLHTVLEPWGRRG